MIGMIAKAINDIIQNGITRTSEICSFTYNTPVSDAILPALTLHMLRFPIGTVFPKNSRPLLDQLPFQLANPVGVNSLLTGTPNNRFKLFGCFQRSLELELCTKSSSSLIIRRLIDPPPAQADHNQST